MAPGCVGALKCSPARVFACPMAETTTSSEKPLLPQLALDGLTAALDDLPDDVGGHEIHATRTLRQPEVVGSENVPARVRDTISDRLENAWCRHALHLYCDAQPTVGDGASVESIRSARRAACTWPEHLS